MPHLVSHDLIVWILRNITDPGAFVPLGKGFDFLSIQRNGAAAFSERSNRRFELFQKCAFSAPGFAEQQNKIAFINGEVDIFETCAAGFRVGKIQPADCNLFHVRASFPSTAAGSRQNKA